MWDRIRIQNVDTTNQGAAIVRIAKSKSGLYAQVYDTHTKSPMSSGPRGARALGERRSCPSLRLEVEMADMANRLIRENKLERCDIRASLVRKETVYHSSTPAWAGP